MKKEEEVDQNTNDKSREHLANERTFLAWVRTSIALMGFGFVIVKFALFQKQVAMLMEPVNLMPKGNSSKAGVVMIILGVVLTFMAYLQYKKHEKQLKNNNYHPSSTLLLFITLILMIGGLILSVYLFPVI